MSSITSTNYSRERLHDLLFLVQTNATFRWPRVSYLLNSDLAWRLPGSNPKANLRLWYDDTGIAAYAWFELTGLSTFDLRHDISWDSEIAVMILDWLESRRTRFEPLAPWFIDLNSMQEWETALTNNLHLTRGEQSFLHLGCFDLDIERSQFLADQGYSATQHFGYYMTRSLDNEIPEASMPAGMYLKQVNHDDFAERVATHRDAWFKSTYTLENYLKLRSIDIFDPELDLVAVAEDGTFASYCIAWKDESVGVGSFEPVGTRPAFRRLGLGQQVNYEGLRRMKAKGMHSAKIGTAGFNDRAFGLYSSCGFELRDKERTYIKAL